MPLTHLLLRPFSWSVGLFALLLLGSPAARALEEGKPAPAFEIALADGTVFKSGEARGEVLIINLWATWCAFCREEMPALESYYQQHKGEGLHLIAVSMDEADAEAKAREIMQAYSYPVGIGRQSKLKGFGRIWRLPMTFVIDRQGILRRDGSEGEPKVDLATLEKQVTPLLRNF
jgi:peroxiredoxin